MDPSWGAGSLYSTAQQWDTASDWTNVSPASGDGNFLINSNPTALAIPRLSVTGNINNTPYLFNGGQISATIPNYGGAVGGTLAGVNAAGILADTRVVVQIATTTGGAGTALEPTGLGSNILPGSLHLTIDGLRYSTLAAEPVLIDSRPNAANFGFEFEGTTFTPNAEQWLYTFYVPGWTGDLGVAFEQQPHGIFEALRVDTQLVALRGDYNADGRVDAADYTVWADHFGQTGAGAAGDGNFDGAVDAADYTVWADHFGQGAPPSALPVPEAGALGLLAPAMTPLLRRRRRDELGIVRPPCSGHHLGRA